MTGTATSSWQAGTLLEDRYLLTEPAGRGGSATVWHARDERLGRMVAVKLLRTELLDDEAALNRLQVEAQALARLRHPNLADVYDYALVRHGSQLSAAYLVMELIDGAPSPGCWPTTPTCPGSRPRGSGRRPPTGWPPHTPAASSTATSPPATSCSPRTA
ncbi:hypothetical protein ACFQZ4_05660 [Catellatospora coxensis]